MIINNKLISRNTIKTSLKFWISQNKVNNWFNEKEVFFILGLGRSGTDFLANLLNQGENVAVFHEPAYEDFQAIVQAHKSEIKATEYIKNFRKKYIYCKNKDRKFKIYGEVNSVLRYHVIALKEFFPKAKFLHLIRDGRDVVRSFMARGHYTGDSIGHHSIKPRIDDPYYQKWEDFTRFEKLCWLWMDSNNRIAPFIENHIKFEDMLGDYSYFHSNIESYLNIKIGKSLWSEYVSKPSNITKIQILPHWEEWDIEQTESFNRICGETMRKYGYI